MQRPAESVVDGSQAQAKDLPSVDKLLRAAGALVAEHGHTCVAEEARALLEALDRKSTRLNSSHIPLSRMPSSA